MKVMRLAKAKAGEKNYCCNTFTGGCCNTYSTTGC